ncbi:MAG: DEAD/DEAH box helicase family protein [Chloroflexi bacterium]|nr:DEAD/DEAH box helicase family protein [Chloroflexota bacterium]
MPLPDEAVTRRDLIDPALAKAGWDVNDKVQVGIEIPVDGSDPQLWAQLAPQLRAMRDPGGGYTADLPPGVADYLLYHETGEVLAVVEAKKLAVDPIKAEAQAEYYINEIGRWPTQTFQPFAFMTNGERIRFWDIGRANPRDVAGFFTLDDLKNLLYIREKQKPLATAAIKPEIAGRLYQIEAIRAVLERFDVAKKRRALLVMATGTGKTRVAMSLADIFIQTNQARKILFVADRDVLVKQALAAFQKFIPAEPGTRIHTHHVEVEKQQRLFAATLQTLSNCFRQFSPAFFDLIIFDESHRSIFNKFGEILNYFDARMIGLTATPANFIDRNTFLLFEHPEERPTFLYTYEEAIREGYLVDYASYQAQTRFQHFGIKWLELDEAARNQLLEEGLDPDSINFEGTDLEKEVSNKDTIRRQWDEILQVAYSDRSGQKIGKTIVFAMSQQHARRLLEVFKEEYPQWPGLARVITHETEYKGKLIEQFKNEDLPRIAISVDMLDTGVDVPAVVNLVFMKQVYSYIKLQQMLGRGTRPFDTVPEEQHYLLPNGQKHDFKIIDFWDNDFNKDPRHVEPAPTTPVLATIFNTRLKLLEAYLDQGAQGEARRVMAALREQMALIPLDSFSVKSRLPAAMKEAWQDDYWRYVTQRQIDDLRLHVAPLLRFAPSGDVEAATFTSKIERLKLQMATGQNPRATVHSLREDAGRLKDEVLTAEQRAARDFILSGDLLSASPARLDELTAQLAGQMGKRAKRQAGPLLLDLPDEMLSGGYVFLWERNRPIYEQEYRDLIDARLVDLIDHPVIAAIERGETVTDAQLLDLEREMRRQLGGNDLGLNEEKIRRAYKVEVDSFLAFMRHQFELDGLPNYADIVTRHFDEFARTHHLNATQTNFLRTIRSQFLKRRKLRLADLYDEPFTRFGADAADRLFTPDQLQEIMLLTQTLVILPEASPS